MAVVGKSAIVDTFLTRSSFLLYKLQSKYCKLRADVAYKLASWSTENCGGLVQILVDVLAYTRI